MSENGEGQEECIQGSEEERGGLLGWRPSSGVSIREVAEEDVAYFAFSLD